MAYATVTDVQTRLTRTLSEAEQTVCEALLEDAAVIIDLAAADASADIKLVVSCRMVSRALGAGDIDIPIGATQGSMSGLGYSQSWTLNSAGGSVGELYLSKLEKKMLGLGDRIGSYSPVEELVSDGGDE